MCGAGAGRVAVWLGGGFPALGNGLWLLEQGEYASDGQRVHVDGAQNVCVSLSLSCLVLS